MAHQRQVIREAVKTALVAANTAAGARVYETRIVPWRTTELPAISVYTSDEEVDPASADSAPRELKRKVQLALEASVAIPESGGNVDDALDDLALAIEKAMHADETFGRKASDSYLSTTETALKVDGDRPMGLLRMVYAVTYYTNAPEAADVSPQPDALKIVDTKWTDLDGGADIHPNNQSEDKLLNLDL